MKLLTYANIVNKFNPIVNYAHIVNEFNPIVNYAHIDFIWTPQNYTSFVKDVK
jgi:hypothetical protein